MSAVEQFESVLKELPTLKAPGVSGSRIKKLTDIAVKNVSEESKLITILYSNCKAAPSSHKLGTLYVVDSIVRIFIDEAKKQNQEINSQAPEGTFASAVNKISELVESLIDDAMDLLINKSQTIKIGKLVDIWERAETFSPEIINRIRSKHFVSTTPPGTPPGTNKEPVKQQPDANSNDSGSILLALASLAKKSNSNSSTPTTSSAVPVQAPQQPAGNNANDILSQLSAMAGNNAQPPAPTNVPQPAQSAPNEQYIFNMLQQMQNGGANVPPQAQPPRQQGQPDYGTGRRGGRNDDNGVTSYSRRNRSRSPNRQGQNNRRERSPPRQQFQQPFPQIPQQFPTQQQAPQHHQHQDGPGGLAATAALNGEMNLPGTAHYRPRNVGFDQALPQGSFKVLSRTLFIGGVPRNMDEKELASVLRPYAEVQSVILNSERKHAFVKVYSRREAEQVITSFNKDNALPLRTRWGVGFGPRDCCNYQHGISIIPIQRLTDADRAWVVQAQWGGTGGQPLLSGMVIDEPDIEIGTGISSKAMSKKMPTNSARNGPKSNKPGEPDEDYVKTTLIPQQNASMSHGAQPDFTTLTQSSVNPLSGLFGNSNSPEQGFANAQPQQPAPNGMQGNFPPPNDFMNTLNQGGGNPNLSAQLANFFQNGGMNQS